MSAPVATAETAPPLALPPPPPLIVKYPPGIQQFEPCDYIHRHDQAGDPRQWRELFNLANNPPAEKPLICPSCLKSIPNSPYTNGDLQLCHVCGWYVCASCCTIKVPERIPQHSEKSTFNPLAMGKCPHCHAGLSMLSAPIQYKVVFGRLMLAGIPDVSFLPKYAATTAVSLEVDNCTIVAQQRLAEGKNEEAAAYATRGLASLNWIESWTPECMFGIYLAAWYRLHLLRASARGLPQEVVRGIVDAKPDAFAKSGLYMCAFQLPPTGLHDTLAEPFYALYLDNLVLPAGLQLARDERAVSHFRCTCCTRNALLRELRYVYRGMATWMGGPLGPIQRVIDIRFVFEAPEEAEAFIARNLKYLSEGQPDLPKARKLGQDCHVFGGRDCMVVMGHRTTAYAYLFRAGTVVCKVFAAQVARGTDGIESTTPLTEDAVYNLAKFAGVRAATFRLAPDHLAAIRQQQKEITAAEEAADHSTSPASAPAVAPTTPAPQPSISTTAPTSAASEGTQSVSTTPAMSAPPAPSA